jgi:glycosyltransferase involved in cell wall biosynthesis
LKVTHVHRIRGIGGSERHLLTLLPALATRGVDVSFVGLDDPRGVLDPFYAQLGASVPFVRLPAPRDLDPVLAVRLPRIVRSLRPDLVHTHLVHADVYGAIAPGTRLVSTKHNPDPFRAGPYRLVERALGRRATRIVAISDALRRFCVEQVGLPAAKIDVVHYGLDDLPSPWADNPQVAVPDGARVLLAVSRLAPQKRLETAIRALRAVRGAQEGVVLVVLGEGPERRALASLAAELGLTDAVFMLGRVGDVAGWYRRSELLVHPASWEGFGLAILEAMLAGRPVVAASGTSADELVAGGLTGLLVPGDDADALASAIVSLLSDPGRAREMGRAGQARAQAEFSVQRMVERTLTVYDRALGNGATRT